MIDIFNIFNILKVYKLYIKYKNLEIKKNRFTEV